MTNKPFEWLEDWEDRYEDVMSHMENVDKKYWPMYSTGLKALDDWYGDKAYRKYYDWLDIMDEMVDTLKNQ